MKVSRDRFIHKWLKVPYSLHVHEYHRPKNPRATVLMIHGIGNSWKTWQNIAPQLPRDVRVLAVDLLGFGSSPKPDWITYNAKVQADSIITTLLRKGLFGPVIIVGHSLGSLVAVELARRYPFTVKSLVLCSPPFYRPRSKEKFFHPERRLRQLYGILERNPMSSSKILKFADKYNLWPDPGFNIDEAGALTFLATLNAAIVNQTSFEDALKLHLQAHIISGKLDPLIVERNIRYLAKHNPKIHHTSLPFVAHDISKPYATRITAAIVDALDGRIDISNI